MWCEQEYTEGFSGSNRDIISRGREDSWVSSRWGATVAAAGAAGEAGVQAAARVAAAAGQQQQQQ